MAFGFASAHTRCESRSTSPRNRRLFAFAAGLLLGAALTADSRTHAQAAPASEERTATLRQVAGILDYIGGDYRGAVKPGGEILDEGEYKEQRSLAEDARSLLLKVGVVATDPVQVTLAELATALADRKDQAAVEALCHQAREVIVKTHAVDLTPKAAPSRPLAEQLYRSQACNTCHGDDGSAQTPAAAALDPKPANFLDAERVSTVSPHRAFHAITHGVSGTAMVSYAKLSEQERWSLAFYVLSLRHLNRDIAKGRRVYESLSAPPAGDARVLSELTEEQLEQALAGISDAEARADAVAYLRAEASFAQSEGNGSMTVAYAQLALGLKAYRTGDRDAARRAFISAYLDGVEPHEAGLRARDPQLVAEIEAAMLALRSAAAEGGPIDKLEAAVAHTRDLLHKAEGGKADERTAFIGAFAIALREGVEIVLLVAALLGLVRKRGQPELAKFVHAGWLLAIPAGLVTFYAAESVLGGMEREMAEGIASLLAAVVLLGVTHWLLGQLGSKQWVGFLARSIGAAVSGKRAAAGVLGLSFIAAYREAFEIVLFFQALVRDAGSARQVWLGAAVGLAVLLVIAVIVLRLGQKLSPGPFMLASSICLAVLCFMLVGKGIHALQEAAVVSLTPLQVPDFPALGIYASAETLALQGLLLLALIGSAVWPRYAAKRAAERSGDAAAAR
ncbi:MAG: FTR1 family protein [Polyangiales bacterium]